MYTSTMTDAIRVAKEYAVKKMEVNREALEDTVEYRIKALDLGSHALVLFEARHWEDSFTLVLAAAIATHEWGVIEIQDADYFYENGGGR